MRDVVTSLRNSFTLTVTFAQKYGDRHGIGKTISTRLPHTFVFWLFLSLLLMVWMLIGLPFGLLYMPPD